ncbi:MAG: hypothetical protein ACRECH_11300 [Nitrososphaerales archaeon]
MANEENKEEEQDKVRATKKKKKSEEDKIHDIIWNSLSDLQADVSSLNKAINFHEDNPRRLAILINARARVQQQIFYCVALLGNPKLKLMTETGRNLDFARMMKRALLDQNPAARKMVDEARKDKENSSSKNESLRPEKEEQRKKEDSSSAKGGNPATGDDSSKALEKKDKV